MTGELAFAGKLLAPLARKAAAKLNGPLGIARWRIARYVKKHTRLEFPDREYLAWLKNLRESDFMEPVESAAPRLALALDDALSAAGPAWELKPGRTSAALRLVEATYEGLRYVLEGRTVGHQDASWARQRNDVVVTRVAELALSRGGWGTVADDDLSIYLKRRSWERRAIRLEAVGVSDAARGKVVEVLRVAPPVVQQGTIRVLVGPFGSGKTETAEAWHLDCADRLASESGAPIPVWIYARDLRNENVEQAVVHAIGGPEILRARGAAVVIDGVDEVDGGAAEAIVRDARILVASNPLTSVLVTSRPHVLVVDEDDLHVTELSESQVSSLLEALGAPANSQFGWPRAVKESTKRPFFALAVASGLAAGKRLGGQATLIRNLVEVALQRGTSQGLMTETELYELLVDLAVDMTQSGGALRAPSYQKEQRALATRIVQRTPLGELQFSLPIFEQWFAAQGLLEATALPRQPFENAQYFDRWRWAIAVAVSGAAAPKVDEIMRATAALNPGAAGWVLSQVGSGSPDPESNLDPDFNRVASRVLGATRAWVDSIGPLAPLCFPIGDASEPIKLGLKVGPNGWLARAWARIPPTTDLVEELPEAAHPLGEPHPDWQVLGGGFPPAGVAWPWLLVRAGISRETLKILERERFLGGGQGVWHDELRYSQCRVISGERTIFHRPMRRSELLAKIDSLLRRFPDASRVDFVLDGGSILGTDVKGLGEWLAGLDRELVERPVPVPDLDGAGSRWIWGAYSDERVTRYAAEVYGNACQAYDELADTTFSAFDWSLGFGAHRPVGVLGVLRRAHTGGLEGQPVLYYEELPLELMTELTAGGDFMVSENGRAAVRCGAEGEDAEGIGRFERHGARLRDWLHAHPQQGPFGSLSAGSSVLDLTGNRPASAIAADNLFSDLKAVGMGDGTFPRFR